MNESFKTTINTNYIVIPSYIYKIKSSFNISTDAFLFLEFLTSVKDLEFDIDNLADMSNLSKDNIFKYLEELRRENLVDIVLKGDKRKKEYLDLSGYYNKVNLLLIKHENNDENILSIIEKEFARTLSPLEREIVSGWIDKGFSEEIIREALKEAALNNVSNLKYVDTILYNWNREGIDTVDKVRARAKQYKKSMDKQLKIEEYDWLEDE